MNSMVHGKIDGRFVLNGRERADVMQELQEDLRKLRELRNTYGIGIDRL